MQTLSEISANFNISYLFACSLNFIDQITTENCKEKIHNIHSYHFHYFRGVPWLFNTMKLELLKFCQRRFHQGILSESFFVPIIFRRFWRFWPFTGNKIRAKYHKISHPQKLIRAKYLKLTSAKYNPLDKSGKMI